MPTRFLISLLLGCATLGAAEGELRVLFVGNSLSYFSDVPGIVAELGAKADPPVTIKVERVMASATSLTRHLGNGKVQPTIKQGGWTHVVLQPFGTLSAEAASLKTYQQLLAGTNTRMILYQTPHAVLDGPSEAGRKNQAAARAFGLEMVKEFNCWLAPAGEACLAAKTADPLLPIRHPARGKGNIHQGPIGSYIAAATIFTVMTGRSPVGIPVERIRADKFAPVDTVLAPGQARWLQTVALRAVLDHPGIGPDWTKPVLPADLPDTTKPSIAMPEAERKAAELAYRWLIYEAMSAANPRVKTEFNAGIFQAIIDDFPGTPDVAKAKELQTARAKKGEKDKTDSDNTPGAQRSE